ncbi:GrpB family protein [Deinococcus sp. UYEF24]
MRLSDPVPAWANAFTQEEAWLDTYLRQARGELEHIGSTAVPGLKAKPILDLAARLPDPAALARFEANLPKLDYHFRNDAGATGGRVWIRKKAGRRTHILHVVLESDQQWQDWLNLRDLLRHSETARQHYAEAKALALATATNRREYTQAKTAIIQRLLSGQAQEAS